MIDVVVDRRLYAIDDENPRVYVDHGGEADLYHFSPTPEFIRRHGNKRYIIKLYREHTDRQREAAEARQTRLRNFPSNLPPAVIKPVALAEDHYGRVIGYVMELVSNTVTLIQLKTPQFREKYRLAPAQILTVLRNLHDLVAAVHASGIVIGDFNDKNVLVKQDLSVLLIDADSLCIAGTESPGYVSAFVDPLICKPHTPDDQKSLNQLVRTKPFTQHTDWYAYAVMAFNLLALIHPLTSGVHRPGKDEKQRQRLQRIHLRLSVFNPSVGLPPMEDAVPFDHWPEKLLACFKAIFEQDVRGVFPKSLFGHQSWITCPSCHTTHGRNKCPSCGKQGFMPQPAHVQARAATTPNNFKTSGTILSVAHHHGGVRYVYHQGSGYRREGGRIILHGNYDPHLSAHVAGNRTVFCAGESFGITNGNPLQALRFTTRMAFGHTTVATNARYAYWLHGNALVRDNGLRGCVTIGALQPAPTAVWVGNRFGAVMVQMGMLTRVLTFDTERTGFTGSTYLPPELGTVVDAHCAIGDKYAWLATVVQENGQTHHKYYVLDARAGLQATTSTVGDTAPWLSCPPKSTLPYGNKLLVPMANTGIVQVGIKDGTLVSEGAYLDSDKLVPNNGTPMALCDAPQGLLVVTPQSISQLTL